MGRHKKFNINTIYLDFWELIGRELSSDDLYSLMLTCKNAYRACKRPKLRSIMSYPMSYPWHLTYEQRNLVKSMEIGTQRFKLINGDVGSGKTIVSTSYAIKKYMSESSDPDSKIVMCGPPSLIQMWWTTLRKYFGIEPCVLHGTNPKYKATESWLKIPDEKFILVSYRLFCLHGNLNWFDNKRDLLIVDEAHHQVSIPFTNFKEVIGLSATTTKKSGLSRGIKYVLRDFNLTAKDCTYNLNKNIISRRLTKVKYFPYDLPTSSFGKTHLINIIRYNKHNVDKKAETSNYDFTCVPTLCKNVSHLVIQDLKEYFTAGFIMVGRKSMKVDIGNSRGYRAAFKDLQLAEPGLTDRQYKKKMVNKATLIILELGMTYPKYNQAYHIIKNANAKGEKVLLFDMSVTYLPFLHKFLLGCGINSYIFSTHYDVTGRQRQLSKFKEDEIPGVLLSSISMLGEGQNVTEANHVIFFGQCMDHTKYYQAIGRCWRYPQSKEVNVHLLFGNKFDRKVYEHACGAIDLKSLDWKSLMG